MFLDHTQQRTTFGRTPLDEWSACHRDLYLTTHDTQTNIHAPGGIRTHDLSRRAAADIRLRPRSHWDQRGIALPFLDHGTRRGWRVTPRPLFTPGKDPVSIVQEAGWASGPVWTGAENLAPTGIWSPDRPAHSQSLYRLRYLAHNQ